MYYIFKLKVLLFHQLKLETRFNSKQIVTALICRIRFSPISGDNRVIYSSNGGSRVQYCVEKCICCSFWPPPNIFMGRWLSVIGLGGFGPALVFVLVCSLYIWQNLSWFSVILHVKEGSSLYYELRSVRSR